MSCWMSSSTIRPNQSPLSISTNRHSSIRRSLSKCETPFLSKAHLSRRSLDLRRRPLRPLLTGNPASRLTRRVLCLLGLLLALAVGFLLLGVLDRGLAGGGAGFGALGAALLDHVEGGSDDGTLVLDGAAGAFFGDFLLSGKGERVSLAFPFLKEIHLFFEICHVFCKGASTNL